MVCPTGQDQAPANGRVSGWAMAHTLELIPMDYGYRHEDREATGTSCHLRMVLREDAGVGGGCHCWRWWSNGRRAISKPSPSPWSYWMEALQHALVSVQPPNLKPGPF